MKDLRSSSGFLFLSWACHRSDWPETFDLETLSKFLSDFSLLILRRVSIPGGGRCKNVPFSIFVVDLELGAVFNWTQPI